MGSFKPLTKAERVALKEKSKKNQQETESDRQDFNFRRAVLREQVKGIKGAEDLKL